MNDLISRHAAIKYLMTNMNWYDEDGYESDDDYKRECITELINGVPSAQPERKKGRWIRDDNGTYSCSVCQSWIPEQQHYYARYCLYCGADMRGEQDE